MPRIQRTSHCGYMCRTDIQSPLVIGLFHAHTPKRWPVADTNEKQNRPIHEKRMRKPKRKKQNRKRLNERKEKKNWKWIGFYKCALRRVIVCGVCSMCSVWTVECVYRYSTPCDAELLTFQSDTWASRHSALIHRYTQMQQANTLRGARARLSVRSVRHRRRVGCIRVWVCIVRCRSFVYRRLQS